MASNESVWCVCGKDEPFETVWAIGPQESNEATLTIKDFALTKEGCRLLQKSWRHCSFVVADKCKANPASSIVVVRKEGLGWDQTKNDVDKHVKTFLGRTYKTIRHISWIFVGRNDAKTKGFFANVNYVMCGSLLEREGGEKFVLSFNGKTHYYDAEAVFKTGDGMVLYEDKERDLRIIVRNNGLATVHAPDVHDDPIEMKMDPSASLA